MRDTAYIKQLVKVLWMPGRRKSHSEGGTEFQKSRRVRRSENKFKKRMKTQKRKKGMVEKTAAGTGRQLHFSPSLQKR